MNLRPGAFALLLLAASASGAAAPAPNEELKALRGKLEALKRDIARGESSRTEAADALKSSEQAISESNRKLAELAAAKAEVDQQLEALEAQHQAVEKRLAKQQQLAARLVYQQYTAPTSGALQALTSGQNPNETARTSVYLDYIARTRREILDGLRTNGDKLRELGAQTAKRQEELAAIQHEQAAERKRLDAQRANHKQTLTSIAAQIERQRKEAGALERDEKRLTKLVQELARLLAARKPPAPPPRGPATAPLKGGVAASPAPPDSSPPRTAAGDTLFERLKGRLLMPVKGELVGRFGSPRSDSGMSWRGLFIQAPAGREVKAVAAGRVVFADWLRGFGNLLILDHGDGFMSLYGNNEALLGRLGEAVTGGDTVATVGSSGGNTTSGLYFELRHQGRPFDPLGWLNLK